jgi:[amino group carrier protein]-lysine/ornithine hydrolase
MTRMTTPDDEFALLRQLVATPSLSGQERAAADVQVGWCRMYMRGATGCDAFVDDAGNAVAILDGGPAADGTAPRAVLLLGHIDTVPGDLPVIERDGQLYGRGAVDAKGPLAAFTAAALRVGPRPGLRIAVVGAVEEEAATSRGARHVLATWPRPDLVVIGEPSGSQRLTLGYKGRLLAWVTVRQPMAHRSGGGSTAAEQALAVWQRVQDVVAAFNEGRVRAWDQVLPTLRAFASHDDGLEDSAHLDLGFRLPPQTPPAALANALLAVAGDAVFDFTGAEMAFQSDKNNALVRAFLSAIRAAGGQPGFLLKTGTSDMNVVGPTWGCPILAYGPGDSRLDHTPEEHISLAEWQQSVDVLTQVLTVL